MLITSPILPALFLTSNAFRLKTPPPKKKQNIDQSVKLGSADKIWTTVLFTAHFLPEKGTFFLVSCGHTAPIWNKNICRRCSFMNRI